MNGGIGLVILIIITVMLFIYLGYVLVNPEKF
jgi:K+-transporting ATPase KdpF subunit